MKTLLFLLIASSVTAQNKKGGVYLTFNDYMHNKLTYEINCKTEKETIRLNEFLNEPYITLFHKKEKIKFLKDSIYGFISCEHPLVRFQEKKHYYLKEKGALWIFYNEKEAPEKKGYAAENPYNNPTVKEYYFSVKGDGKISALTVENIKTAFPKKNNVSEVLDTQFKNINISEYDSLHKMFKINYLMQRKHKGQVTKK